MYIDRRSAKESLNMSTQQQAIQTHQHNQDIAHKILLSIKDIRFGSMEVVIHASKMLQIERKEKFGFATHQYNHPGDATMKIQRCCRT